MDEFDAIMSGGKAPTRRAAAPAAAKTYDPVDAAIRTIYGESGGDPEETRAIASVIVNRSKKSGKPFDQVVLEPNQFEPWNNAEARKRIEALDPNSAEYQAIANAVGGILGGKENPYPGLTHFYAPAAQAALAPKDGRPVKPEWDDGTGQMIGKTMFLGLGEGGGQADDFDALMAGGGVSPDAPPTAEEEAQFAATYGNPDAPQMTSRPTDGLTYDGLKEALPPEQLKTLEILHKGGMLGEDEEVGSARRPYWLSSDGDVKSLAPGAYYVDRKGQLARAPGGEDDHSFGRGFGQGLSDVPLSVAQLLPGAEDSEWGNVLKAKQMGYDASEKGNLISGAGRFTGQLVASAPLLAGAEAAAAPALVSSGLGRFVLGRAGMGMAPGAARIATRGGSLAAEGALQGAGGAALVSSASDAPLSEQLALGAGGGAVLGPVLPAVVGAGRSVGQTVKSLVEPLIEQGRSNIANRIIGNFAEGAPMVPNAEELIPGSVPTLAQATANPGVATLERTVRLGRPTPFAERAAANAEARDVVLEGARGNPQTVADLATARNAVVDQARTTAFQGAGDVDASSIVTALDEALAAPAAHMDEVARPLQAMRDKLVQPPADVTPAELAAFNRAAAQTFGADADALTPEVMSAARSQLGKKFEDIAANTVVKWDDALRSNIGQIISDTAQVVPESSLPPLFKTLQDIASTANTDAISGASYQALTKKGAPLDKLMGAADPTIRQAAGQIREALDDALERSLAAGDANAAPVAAAVGGSGPSSKQLTGLLGRSKEKSLRGLVDDSGKIHVWDAAEETHGDAAKRLGIPYDVGAKDNRLWVHLNDGVPVVEMAEGLKPPATYLKDPNMHFDVPGEGIISGPEYAKLLGDTGAPEAAAPAGTSALEDLRAARLAYKNLKTVEAALRNAGPDKQVSPQAVLSAVKRNFGQYAYQGGGPLGDAAEAAVRAQAARPVRVETRADQVYGMRQSLTDAIDNLESKDTDAAREAANHLRGVRDRVDQSIGASAPAYAEFLELANRSAEPVQAQKYLQRLNLTDMKGKVTLGKVDNALKSIEKARALPGKNPAKSISEATLAQLRALREDLLREENSSLGRPLGPDTAQHIVTNNISSKLNAPLGVGAVAAGLSSHPLVGAALGAGKVFYSMKDKEVMDALASKLLMPEAPPLNTRPPKKQGGRMGQLARPVVPLVGSMLSNRLLGQ